MRSDQAKTIAISEYLEYVEGIKPDKVRLQGDANITHQNPRANYQHSINQIFFDFPRK